MQEEYLKVPKDRVAVLIGTKGKTKQSLEKKTKTKIEIDSKTGEVIIKAKGKDAFTLHTASNIVKAIARGFSPLHAELLLDDSYFLELIDLVEIVGKSEKSLRQRRSRVIGTHGRVRERIEQATNTFISVQGKTIAIIGTEDGLSKSKKAVMMLLEGAEVNTVYKFLSKSERAYEEFTI